MTDTTDITSTMLSILNGLIGGLLATVVMTGVQLGVGGDDPPPTAVFWSKYVGDGPPGAYMLPGMVLHLFYGTVAGGVFAGAVGLIDVLTMSPLTAAIAWGLGYGVFLFIGAAVFWMRIVLALDADIRAASLFLGFHLVYGGVLGAWLGLNLLG